MLQRVVTRDGVKARASVGGGWGGGGVEGRGAWKAVRCARLLTSPK